MFLYKYLSKDFYFYLKIYLSFLGLNIFLTTLFTEIKLKFKYNLESEMTLNNKKLKLDQNV